MALRPQDRYTSPRLLAEDLEAWLADEPIKARREPWAARLWRWVRKHRTLVASAAGVLVAALGVASIAVWRLDAAADRERRAKDEAIEARNAADAARIEAERQSERNEELLALARNSLNRYEALSRSDALTAYGMESVRSELQEAALDYYATLARQSGETDEARADRARALERLGSTYWQMGRFDDARNSLSESQDLYRVLLGLHPDNRDYRRGLAAALSGLGELLTDSQQGPEAELPMTEALDALKRLHQADPNHVEDRLALAYAWSVEGERRRQVGQSAAAAEAMQTGIALLDAADASDLDPPQRRLLALRHARALVQLATLEARALWRAENARTHLNAALAIMDGLVAEQPGFGDAEFTIAQILRILATLQVREDYVDDARALLRDAIDGLARLQQRYPDVPHYRQDMADALYALGTLVRPTPATPASDEAAAQLAEAAAIGRRLVEQYPDQRDRKLALTRYLGALAVASDSRGDPAAADEYFAEAASLFDALARQVGDNLDQLLALGGGQVQAAGHLAAAGRHDAALTMLDGAEQTLNRLVALAPNYGEAHAALANLHLERAASLEARGRLVDSLAEFDRLIERCDRLAAVGDQPWMQELARNLRRAAEAGRAALAERMRNGEPPGDAAKEVDGSP